jgi:hypothetical protein
MQPNPSAFVTLRQVVEARPWITERWLRRAVQEHRVPFYKVDGRLLFDLDELDQYVMSQRVEAKVAAKPVKRIPRRKKAES